MPIRQRGRTALVPSAPTGKCGASCSDLGGHDVDRLAAALGAELDGAGSQGEQGVVLAAADVVAGVELGTALADDDLTGADDLTAETLDAEALGVGVAAVPGGAGALLRCHLSPAFLWCERGVTGPGAARLLDAGDLDAGQLLAVTLPTAVAGLVLELHDRDLLAALGAHDLGGDGDLGEVVGTGGHLVAVHEHERGEVDGVTDLAANPVHDDDVADGHLLLSAAGLDDRVHHVAAHLCRFEGRALRPGPARARHTRGARLTRADALGYAPRGAGANVLGPRAAPDPCGIGH